MFFLTCFLQHFLTLLCRSEGPCLAPRLSFLDNMWVSTLHRCCSCRPPFRFARSLDVTQSSKIFVLFMSTMRSCDSLLNSLISFVCLKSHEGLFVRVVLELLDQLFGCVFAGVSCCSTAERGAPGIL